MRISRTVYWSAETGTTIPLDLWLGIANDRFSPGVREMCCRESLHCSFEVAGDNLCRTAQVTLSGSTIRRLVETQGRAVLSAQQTGALPPSFTAADCTDQTVISGTDGVMVPLVTEQQKRQRRQTEAIKRVEQGRRSTARVGRPRKGSDSDYGEGTPKARAWCQEMMGVVWEQGSLVLLHRLGPYLRRHRGVKRAALESLRQYVGKRVSMTDYPAFRKRGYDCGSGPTESECGTLTHRLKGAGMRWDKDNAESVMALVSLYHSGLWRQYWKTQRRAA